MSWSDWSSSTSWYDRPPPPPPPPSRPPRPRPPDGTRPPDQSQNNNNNNNNYNNNNYNSNNNNNTGQESSTISTQLLVGIIGGVIGGLLLLTILICCFCNRNKQRHHQQNNGNSSSYVTERRGVRGAEKTHLSPHLTHYQKKERSPAIERKTPTAPPAPSHAATLTPVHGTKPSEKMMPVSQPVYYSYPVLRQPGSHGNRYSAHNRQYYHTGSYICIDDASLKDGSSPYVIVNTLENQIIAVPKSGHTSSTNSSGSDLGPLPFNLPEVVTPAVWSIVESCLIDPQKLRLGKVLGKGQFGVVYEGTLRAGGKHSIRRNTVAVKTILGTQCSRATVAEFLEEAIRMRDFRHPNVISLIGVVVQNNRPLVILPFMKNGDLKEFLMGIKNKLSLRELLKFGTDVAQGMTYLAEQGFIHRDLATRNCVVDASLVVKLSDFGLSRDIYTTEYYHVTKVNRPMPIRWMAPECLDMQVFTAKTDVWSYGVTLWEIFTRGETPFRGMINDSVVACVRQGARLPSPPFCPPEIYAVMQKCWLPQPEQRPDFPGLVNDLRIINKATSKHLARIYIQPAAPLN